MNTVDSFRVTDVWANGETSPTLTLTLDFLGDSDGSRPKQQITPPVFALVAAMMAHGRPAYYSDTLDAISTDPFFASHQPDPQPAGPLKVVDTDLMWSFKDNTGKLILVLENGSVFYVDIADPGLLVGWTLTSRSHAVVFNGTSLKSRPTGEQKDPPVASVTALARIF